MRRWLLAAVSLAGNPGPGLEGLIAAVVKYVRHFRCRLNCSWIKGPRIRPGAFSVYNHGLTRTNTDLLAAKMQKVDRGAARVFTKAL